jgi:hypothetical protein
MKGSFWQSSSVAQLIVQTVGLSMIVRGSGDTAMQVNSDRHSDDVVQGSAKFPG